MAGRRDGQQGYPAVNHCEWSGVFPRREVPLSERKDVYLGADEHNKALLASIRPASNDDVILEKSLEDAAKGFATKPMTANELREYLQGKRLRLIKRFVITQSTGKKRVIDDAAAGGQSDTSTDENILQFCSAVQPGGHLAQLVAALAELDMQWPEGETIVTAGEDWPDAYRYTPMSSEESRGCVVVYWHAALKQPVFQVHHGLQYGLPIAVNSVNRWSKFGEALVRRLLSTLFSMYYDDATLQDWASTGAHG